MTPFRSLVRPVLVCALLALPGLARAESFKVDGSEIELTPPSGFCTLDPNGPAEKAMIEAMRRSIGENMALYVAFGDCTELVELRAGRRDRLNRFGQIEVLLEDKKEFHIKGPPESFLAAVVKSIPDATPAALAANGDAQFAGGADAPASMVGLLGQDPGAVYVGNTVVQSAADEKVMIGGVVGVTVVRGVPIAVNLYTAYPGGEGQGTAVMDELLATVRSAVLDAQAVNDLLEEAKPRSLPPPTDAQWRSIARTALVGGLLGAAGGGLIVLAIILLRRRRRPAAEATAGEARSS